MTSQGHGRLGSMVFTKPKASAGRWHTIREAYPEMLCGRTLVNRSFCLGGCPHASPCSAHIPGCNKTWKINKLNCLPLPPRLCLAPFEENQFCLFTERLLMSQVSFKNRGCQGKGEKRGVFFCHVATSCPPVLCSLLQWHRVNLQLQNANYILKVNFKKITNPPKKTLLCV